MSSKYVFLLTAITLNLSSFCASANNTQEQQELVIQQQTKLLELVEQKQLCEYACPPELEITNLFDEESEEFFYQSTDFSAQNYGPDVCQAILSSKPIHPFRQSEVNFIIQLDCKTTSNEWKEQMLVSVNDLVSKSTLKLIGLCREDSSGASCSFNYYEPVFTEDYDAQKCSNYKSQKAYQRRRELIDYEDQELLTLARRYKGQYFISDDLLNTLKYELDTVKNYHKKVDSQSYPGRGYDSNVTSAGGMRSTNFSMLLESSFEDYFDNKIPESLQCINHFWHFNRISLAIYKSVYSETKDWQYFILNHSTSDRKFTAEYESLVFIKKSKNYDNFFTYPCAWGVSIFDHSDTERLYLVKGKWIGCPLGCSDRTFDEFLINDQGELTYVGLKKPKTKDDFEFVYTEKCEGTPHKLNRNYFKYPYN